MVSLRSRLARYGHKVHVLGELLTQHVSRPDVAIIGSVHKNNVGDMALSHSVQHVLGEHAVHGGMQMIGGGRLGLSKWPFGHKAIVAGGALGREKVLRTVVQKYLTDPQDVAMVGMAFWSFDDLSEETLRFLRDAAFLSCRNRRDVEELSNRGIEAEFAYDNAFSLPQNDGEREDRTLGVNVVPRHMKRQDGKYVPSEANPRFGRSYARVLRDIVADYLAKGWDVIHVPFTTQDEDLSRQVFRGMDVHCRGYTFDVEETSRAVSACSRFIGTRYHAHVFALKSMVPFYSVSYARKCRHLREELGIPAHLQATRKDIVEQPGAIVDRFTSRDGFVLSERKLSSVKKSARSSIEEAAHSVGVL